MEYIKHEIEPTGRIFIIETGNHRTPIEPNQPVPKKYNEQIEADPDFAKYRTQENADAYEQSLIPEPPTKEQLQAELEAEARRIAMDDLIEERIKADPYLSAMANIKAKIESGEINENASRAIRDEIKRK